MAGLTVQPQSVSAASASSVLESRGDVIPGAAEGLVEGEAGGAGGVRAGREAVDVAQASLLVEGGDGLETTMSGSSRYAGLLEEKIDTPATEVLPSAQVPAGVLVNSAAVNGGDGLGAQAK